MKTFLLSAILVVLIVQAFLLWGITEYFGVFSFQQEASPISTPSEEFVPPEPPPSAVAQDGEPGYYLDGELGDGPVPEPDDDMSTYPADDNPMQEVYNECVESGTDPEVCGQL